jgi:uncharacterized membrane protein SpoIIM required for sporulation
MNIAMSLVICSLALIIGFIFALFPRWCLRVVSRGASSYMSEDLSADPVQVLVFRFYGIAAVGLSAYALYQVVLFSVAGP